MRNNFHYTTNLGPRTRVEVDCIYCDITEDIVVPTGHYEAWVEGELAQQAMPTLTPLTRDVLITNMCTRCLNGLYEDKGE